MPETNPPVRMPGALPGNYQEALSWKVTEKQSRVAIMNLLGLLLFFISGLIFFMLALWLGKMPGEGQYDLGKISLVLAGSVLTFILHELIHGLSMQLFGAKPRYGIIWKGMMLYATSPGYAFRRNEYLVIALAPFVLFSILVVLGMWGLQGTLWVALLGICGAINASGAIGDLWITMIVLRYATTAYVMDEQDGIRVFLPKP